MSLLPILTYPNPVLAKKALPVVRFDDELRTLIADMAETMYAASGIGLAAPQVGKLLRVIVVDVEPPESKSQLHVLVNPVLVGAQGETEFQEGCLSIPDVHESVPRHARVMVRAQDGDGAEFVLEADGLLAVCIQHELDHLSGVLFIDRISRLKRRMALQYYRKGSR